MGRVADDVEVNAIQPTQKRTSATRATRDFPLFIGSSSSV
jgi:hypothetical protein